MACGSTTTLTGTVSLENQISKSCLPYHHVVSTATSIRPRSERFGSLRCLRPQPIRALSSVPEETGRTLWPESREEVWNRAQLSSLEGEWRGRENGERGKTKETHTLSGYCGEYLPAFIGHMVLERGNKKFGSYKNGFSTTLFIRVSWLWTKNKQIGNKFHPHLTQVDTHETNT